MNQLIIGERTIGVDHRPYIIAEAGVHHYNSIELAKAYILQAKIAGADAIKFQTYDADRIATVWAPTYWDDPSGKTQHDIFADRANLSLDAYQELFAYAQALNIEFLSTPFDPDAAQLLNDLGVQAFKIASADLTYYPLLEKVASFGKPILLSTGAATYDEIAQTIQFLSQFEARVSLLHCVLSYPTPIADANLSRITILQDQFPDLVIGYSDHTQPQDSMLACPMAVGLGARVIEKHFTLNKELDGDDHYHAVDATGLQQLVRDCSDAWLMTSSPAEMKAAEQPARTYARRSIVAVEDLEAGTVLTMSHLDFKRPGTGLSPKDVQLVLGKTLTRTLKRDELVELNDLRGI